ncbi:MAG: CopG family transcriptional regulator, partial [Candidatus Cloacimonadota bacterium]
MKNKIIKYTNEYLGKVKIVKDFLPPSEQFAFKEDTVRVTLLLSRFSVDFFRFEAKK